VYVGLTLDDSFGLHIVTRDRSGSIRGVVFKYGQYDRFSMTSNMAFIVQRLMHDHKNIREACASSSDAPLGRKI
jgi:hypothetical protein